jgi:hypothetical protein
MFSLCTLDMANGLLLRCKDKGKVVPMAWRHAMKTWGNGRISTSTLNLNLYGGDWPASRLGLFTQGGSPWCLLYRRLCGRRIRSEQNGEDKIVFPLPEIEPRPRSLVAIPIELSQLLCWIVYVYCFQYLCWTPLIVAARYMAWTVFARSKAGIVSSNTTQDTDICLRLICVCVVLCVGSDLVTGWSPVQGVLPTV